MCKIRIILPFLLLTFFTHAQTSNFFADGSRWVYYTWENSEPGQQTVFSSDEQNIIHGDTTINGLTYFKLYTTIHTTLQILVSNPSYYVHFYDSIGPSFIRYDTIFKQVFYLPGVDSTERLIYDFNLQVGDTMPMQSPDFPGSVIDSIDTIVLFGVQVKRFFLDIGDSGNYWLNFIIEGMGGSNGLSYFRPEFGSVSGGTVMTHLQCFQFGDSIFTFNAFECPFIDFISGNEEIGLQHNFTIEMGPNPTQGFFTITIDEALLNSRFILSDCYGRIAQSFTLTESNTIGSIQAPGIYFWLVEEKGRLIKTGKLLVQ